MVSSTRLTENFLIPVGTNDEDGKNHDESGRNENGKDTPPPDHHLLLLSEKRPEEEQEGEFDADDGNSKERRDSILQLLAQYEQRDEVCRRVF